jgi:GNAT superfamily N-acetyltransferase
MTQFELAAPARYQPAQREALLAFLQRAYGSSSLFAQESYVRWLYEEGQGSALYLQWIDGRVVGQLGSQRCLLSVGGKDVLAHWAVNFFVDPELQHAGIGAALANFRKLDTPISLSIEVTPFAVKTAKRVGSVSAGAVPIFARALTGRAISRRFGSWTRPFALLAMPGLAALDWFAERTLRAEKVELHPVPAFDERADKLWADNRGRYPVVSDRSAAALNWRFAKYPVPGRYKLFYVLRAGAAIGYVVLRTELRDGLLDGVVVDFFCAPEATYTVLAAAAGRLRAEGAGAIFCLVCLPGQASPFRRLGFVRRPGAWPLYVRTTGVEPVLEGQLRQLSNWFLTSAESDIDRPR